MEHHASLWTDLLNGLLGIHVPDEIVMSTLVFLVLATLAIVGGRRWAKKTAAGYEPAESAVTTPGTGQQVAEVAIGGFAGLLEDTIPHHGRRHIRTIGGFGAFILVGNLFGLIPTLTPPTQNISITLGLALISFCYYNAVAVKEVGLVNYLKHFAGPLPAIAIIMIPIELIGHLARNLSLSMRLFGNIFGEHTASGVFYTFLDGFLVPLPMMFLGLFAAFLQAFIFCLLSMIYIALATEH